MRWGMVRIEKKEEFDVSKWIGILFLGGIIITFILLFNGGLKIFNENTQNIGVLLAVGMLTFLSIFFNLINPYTKLIDHFSRYVDSDIKQMETKAFKKLKSKDYTGVRMLTIDIEQKQNLTKWIKIDLWLFLSILLYLLSIPFGLISNQNIANAFTTRDIQGVLFYLGYMTTFFLVTSIMVTSLVKLHSLKNKDRLTKMSKK